MAQITNWTWYVSSMYTLDNLVENPNYVVMVTWRLKGTDGTYEAEVGNNATFSEFNEEADFIPYQNLTEETVIGWVQNQLGEDGINSYKAKTQAIIDEKANPPLIPIYTPLPWSN
jgi:hypothetical protein